MILLIGLTVIAVLLVVQNTLSLLIGIKALPLSSKQFSPCCLVGPPRGAVLCSCSVRFGAFSRSILIQEWTRQVPNSIPTMNSLLVLEGPVLTNR
jgi:hypothetical protein